MILNRQTRLLKEDGNYKLVFMDCNMPLMNGYTACLKLKDFIKKGKIDDMKIIACTADTSMHNL